MKNIMKKAPIRYGILIVLLIGLIVSGLSLFGKNDDVETTAQETSKQVITQTVDFDSMNSGQIETVGVVEAGASIDVISTTAGTVKSLPFKIGDEVRTNQLLAQLYNSSSLTSLNNAQTNLNNSRSSLAATERIANESISQAEIGVEQAQVGVKNADKAIDSAKLGLKSAQDNLSNAKDLQEKRVSDLKNSTAISFNGYLNTIFNSLDQVADLINADTDITLNPALGAKDPETIIRTKASYAKLNDLYNELAKINTGPETIEDDIQLAINGLSLTEQMLSNAIQMLDASVSGSNYPQSLINSQKSAFIAMRTGVVQSQNSAKSESQALSTILISNESELEGLENALSAARNQLAIAETAKDNALVALKNAEQAVVNAKEARDQQILGAKTQVDNARGQYNLTQTQASDLIVKAPISGKITGKYVEVGTEVSPGQKIAQVSQLDTMKIVVNLSSQDIYRIKLGQKVYIEDELEAYITSINPAADPVSKKVEVEINYDNQDDILIQGTFVDVLIPVESIKTSQAGAVFVPLRAVTITQNESYVFINDNGTAKKVQVEIGRNENALVEILSGLQDGDELIVEGAKLLEDGDKIEIK